MPKKIMERLPASMNSTCTSSFAGVLLGLPSDVVSFSASMEMLLRRTGLITCEGWPTKSILPEVCQKLRIVTNSIKHRTTKPPLRLTATVSAMAACGAPARNICTVLLSAES
eukprot:TRINITY_DN71606_c0_g1_i1.p2 TRINITY_DN71606_c0_g1~~TRINITY_DN71606_c0_g1_i1.p2  ORF type:complete len:112 (-),score=20.20 TRINITY_DN71606_c0_g1_i1:22-357(-)